MAKGNPLGSVFNRFLIILPFGLLAFLVTYTFHDGLRHWINDYVLKEYTLWFYILIVPLSAGALWGIKILKKVFTSSGYMKHL